MGDGQDGGASGAALAWQASPLAVSAARLLPGRSSLRPLAIRPLQVAPEVVEAIKQDVTTHRLVVFRDQARRQEPRIEQ